MHQPAAPHGGPRITPRARRLIAERGLDATTFSDRDLVTGDDVLSIEHEDHLIDPLEGVRKSVELLQRVIPRAPASYAVPQV